MSDTDTNPLLPFRRKVIFATAVLLVAVALLGLIWKTWSILLLIFFGLLFGIFLHGSAKILCRFLPLKVPFASGLLAFLLLLALVGFFCFFGPRISDQFKELWDVIPNSVETLNQKVHESGVGEPLLSEDVWIGQLLPKDSTIIQRLTGIFSSVTGAVVAVLVIYITGIYFAVNPGIYRQGFLRLIPRHHERRADQILVTLKKTLGWWIVGRLASMAVIGILTALGLWALQMPMVLSLAIIAALLSFIPNIGPILSVIPAGLIALMTGWEKALAVAVLYVLIQTIESYFITPYIQQRAVSIPPVLLLSVQLLFGLLCGLLGVILATPLTVAAMVLIRQLYVSDHLGKEVEKLYDH